MSRSGDLGLLREQAQIEDGTVEVEAGLMAILDRMRTGKLKVFKEHRSKRRQTVGAFAASNNRPRSSAGRPNLLRRCYRVRRLFLPKWEEDGRRLVTAQFIWKEITTAFKGRMIGGLYAVENEIVRVRTPLGEKVAELEGANAVWVAWRLVREMASEGKA